VRRIIVHMSTKTPTIVARLTSVALSSRDEHARQRELVRASLLAR
jgi:hypothetical protein